jgi:hypothetical protein
MLCIEAHERRSVFEPAQIALLASVIDVARSHEILFEVSELELHTGLKLAHARMDAGTPADEYLRRTEKGGLHGRPCLQHHLGLKPRDQKCAPCRDAIA